VERALKIRKSSENGGRASPVVVHRPSYKVPSMLCGVGEALVEKGNCHGLRGETRQIIVRRANRGGSATLGANGSIRLLVGMIGGKVR